MECAGITHKFEITRHAIRSDQDDNAIYVGPIGLAFDIVFPTACFFESP